MYGQKTYRKRPLFHAPSISSDVSEKQSIGRQSLVSKRSGALSRKSVGSEIVEGLRQDSKWLKPREYLLLIIEAGLSLTAYVIRERNLSSDELERVNLTNRQTGLYMIYAEGYSCLLCLVVGVLADSYFKHYTVALFTVILHFATVCVVFMEDTIKGNQKGNPYAPLVFNVCTATLVLIKSSDFTRLVYGLEGMTNRRRSTVYVFLFLHFWVSSYATYGGIILNVFNGLFIYTQVRLSIVAFVFTGISLYLFVYVLYPEESKREQSGLGCRVVGCLLLASYYKLLRIKKRGKRGFLGNTEGKYDKLTIARTKEIFLLYALLMPTVGIVFHTMMRSNLFYPTIWNKVKSNDVTRTVGLTQMARAILAVTMLFSYFGLWPLLNLIGVRNKSVIKFLIGHLLSVFSIFYAAMLMKSLEVPQFISSSGFVRVFNTREDQVVLLPQDTDFTTHVFPVDPKSGVMVAYPCSSEVLFAMQAVFNGTTTYFSLFLSVAPDQTTGYMVLDPPQIVRIRGPYLPLREGPPGTNRGSWPRVFFYNTAVTLQDAKVRIRQPHHRKTVREVSLDAGAMTTVTLEPDTYDFSIPTVDIYKEFAIEEGGVYGIMIYATTTTREMELDTVIPPNTASPWGFLGLYIVFGLAAAISYPTMRGIIFTIAPHGLTAMAFACISFLEGVCLWIGYVGFVTWHYYITAPAIFAYAFGETLFFFLCMFVLLKFKDSYT